MDTETKRLIYRRILEGVCLCVLAGILAAGLWPFHTPKNEVSWLNDGTGLRFGDYGSILSSGTFKPSNAGKETPISVEIWMEPGLVDDSNTILAFYRGEKSLIPFSLHQSLSDLVVERETLDPPHHPTPIKFFVDNVFSQNKRIFVTVTSGSQDTRVYVDGVLAKVSSRFVVTSEDLTGRLIIANSPTNNDSWSGRLSGLAIYQRGLTAEQVLQHYQSWTKTGRQDAENDHAVALYLFKEGKGTVVHNQVEPSTDLLIPQRYFVLHSAFLVPPWKEYYPGWTYWKNIGINIAGLIPLGLFLCIYFTHILGMKRGVAAAIVVGFLVSLTIEVSQAFLPTRDSGMTDIITNTLGTLLGTMFCSASVVQTLLANFGLSALEPNARGRINSDLAMVRTRPVLAIPQNEKPK
jgi:VanZ like family/Concanavalin A-like lectin/glucanases superfamily